MLIMFVCADLTLTPRAQVYLCLRCYHKFMRDKERILIFSTYDEFKHPSIFGVCALLLILLRINKRKTLLSSSHFVFCSVFFKKNNNNLCKYACDSRDHAKAHGNLTTKWRTIAHGHYNRMFQGQFYVTHKRTDILEGRYFI